MSEFQVLDGIAITLDDLEGVYSDLEVRTDEGGRDLFVALCGLDPLGDHGLVAHEQEGAGWYLVVEAHGEEGRCLHVDGHGPHDLELPFERFVVFPDSPVGGVDRACPVVQGVVPYDARDGSL